MELETETLVLTEATVEEHYLLNPSLRTRVPPTVAPAAREWSIARAIGSVPGTCKARLEVLKALDALPPDELAGMFGRNVEVRVGVPWLVRSYEVRLADLADFLAGGALVGANYVMSRDADRLYVSVWR